MSTSRIALLRLAFLGASAVVASSANAGATWRLDATAPVPISCTGSSAAMNCVGNADAGGVMTQMTAWSAATGAAFVRGTLGSWDGSGFGVSYSGESTNDGKNHALDNEIKTDAILLKFDQAVALNFLKIGWSTSDSDISVLRYVPPNAQSTSGQSALDGKLLGDSTLSGSLVQSGWSLVSNVSSANYVSGTATFNAGNLTSSWWLISAYNGKYGGTQLDNTLDYVKLLEVGSNAVIPRTGTPEPASLALAGVALAAMVGVNRRRKQKAHAAD